MKSSENSGAFQNSADKNWKLGFWLRQEWRGQDFLKNDDAKKSNQQEMAFPQYIW